MKGFIKKMKSFQKGFTLVELIVSIAIFMMIMLAAMGSLFVSLDSVRKVRAQQISIDSINYAVESMTRSIRLGTNYHSCYSDCEDITELTSTRDSQGDEDEISFVPQNYEDIESRITYRKSGDTLERCVEGVCSGIVSPDVKITTLRFDVKGAENKSPEYHPRVYILIGGEVRVRADEVTSFAIQTIATQRNLK